MGKTRVALYLELPYIQVVEYSTQHYRINISAKKSAKLILAPNHLKD
jgi:hypothetical protein